jgi:hypothetical protein
MFMSRVLCDDQNAPSCHRSNGTNLQKLCFSDAKMASPSRRSARKKARVSYDESLVEVKQEQEVSKRRGPPKKRPVANFSSGSEDEEESQKPPPSKKSKNTRGSVQDRTCPHCKKVSSSKSGLKYHIGENLIKKKPARFCNHYKERSHHPSL